MNDINSLPKTENSPFNTFENVNDTKKRHINSAYIKQVIHDRRVDEFFWTDVEAPPKRTSILAALGSIVGVAVPVVLIARKQHPELKADFIKNIKKVLKIKYELPAVLAVGLGGVLGGLTGGLLDRKEKGKIEKLEEASFQAMNVAFPPILISGSMKLCEKYKSLNNPIIKGVLLLGSIFLGAATAINLSNKLDDAYFDKHLPDGDRKFKKKDFIIHIDDFLGALVVAKIPFADKLHADKILPLIYAWGGYHVGEAGIHNLEDNLHKPPKN